MRSQGLTGVLLAMLVSACAGMPPGVSAPPEPLMEQAATLRVEGNRLFLPITLDSIATDALLDSGAEMTLIDAGFAEAAGITGAGHAEARGTGAGTQSVSFAEGLHVVAGNVHLADMTAAILDLTDIAERVVGHPLTVILGRDLFDAAILAIDIEAGRLEVIAAADLPAHEPIMLTEAHGIKQMPALINGISVNADFDLGNGNEILLSRSFAERAGLLGPETVIGTREGGGIGGPVERTLVRVETLEVGGHVFRDVTAAVSPKDDGAEANLGVSVLRAFRLVVDFAGGRVWIEPRLP